MEAIEDIFRMYTDCLGDKDQRNTRKKCVKKINHRTNYDKAFSFFTEKLQNINKTFFEVKIGEEVFTQVNYFKEV